jgi:hypothetical protein
MSSFYQMLGSFPESEQPDEPNEEQSEQGEQVPSGYDSDLSVFEHLPDGWKPEQKFASSEEELQFYRDKYPGLWKHINSDDFINGFLDIYGDKIASKESEIDSVLQLIKALNTDPETFIAAHLPEYADKLGIGRVYNSDEIGDYIESTIAEEFGENWRDVYNPADLVRRNSVSAQILKRTQQLEDQLEQHNVKVAANRNKYLQNLASKQSQPAANPQQMNEQQFDSILDSMVESYYSELAGQGITEDEFIEMAIQSFEYKPTMKDIYRVMKYDQLVEQERKKAYEEGRKSMVNEYKKGSKKAAADYVPSERVEEEYKPKSFMGLRI